MRMQSISSMLLVLLLVGLAACSGEGNDESGTTTEVLAAGVTTTADPTTSVASTTTSAPLTAAEGLAVATELADAWIAGWDVKDPEAVVAVFTEDAVYVDTNGAVYAGAEAIMRDVRGGTPIAPARITNVTRWGDGYRFGVRFGWSDRTWVQDVELQLDGELASRIAWTAYPDEYRGTNEHLFDAEYIGLTEVVSDTTCEEGLIPVEIVAWGEEAELGSFQATARHCNDLEAGEVLDGQLVITTAEGDEVYGTYSGAITTVNPDGSMDVQLVQTYEGGTGRFADAVGEADEPCHVQYFSETQALVHGSLIGTLTYDAES